MNDLPIALQSKDLIGLLLFVLGTIATTAVLTFVPRLRAAVFFCIVAGVATSSWANLDLNIFSAYWYRGSTRGFEVNLFDILGLGLLFSLWLVPQPGALRRFWPASLGLMIVFLLYCIGNTVLADPFIFGLFEVTKLVRGIVLFLAAAMYVREERDLSVLAFALAAVVLAESLLATRQRLLLHMYRPGGTLDHPNSLSMFLCMVSPVLVAAACSTLGPWLRRLCWLAVGTAAVTMVLTLSRAGLPIFLAVTGGAMVWCGSWRITPGKLALAFVAVVALAGVVLKSWPLLSARFGQATLEEEYFDSPGETRGYYFRQAGVILAERPFGVGFNNWSYWVSKEYGKSLGMTYQNYDDIAYAPPQDLLYQYRYAAPAHNLGVLTAAELGWVGLILLLVLWLRWLAMGARFLFSRRPEALHRVGVGLAFGLLGVFLHSFTEWIFRQTPIFQMFHVLVGVLAALLALQQAEATATDEEAEIPEEWDAEPLASQPAPASL
ncbi:MAG TPA: O-antigen ligase family protein [Lacunisphaera sp.]|nr:O-antigen ligase family protein [Lacunisphaera sp.]